MSATGFQPEPSAKAPWTRTTFLTPPYATEANARTSAAVRATLFMWHLIGQSQTQANKFADCYVNEVHPNASEAVISCGRLRTKVQSRRPLVREAGGEAVARCGLPMTPLLGLTCLHAARRPTSTTAWAKACGASCGR